LSREVAALRKNDRATQLSEYHFRLTEAAKRLSQKMGELSQKLQRHGNLFHIQWHGPNHFQRTLNKSAEKDHFASRAFIVTVNNHKHYIQIWYDVYSCGEECEIQRAFHGGLTGEPTPELIEEPYLVLRYQGDVVPDAEICAADLERATGRAITLLGERINLDR